MTGWRARFVIGLGGNLGADAAIVARFGAVAAAWVEHGVVRASRVYRSPALTVGDPDFLNAALAVTPHRSWLPHEVLARLQLLEAAAGRDRAREGRWRPRPLDLDLLYWAEHTVDERDLIVPHARLHERSFALAPLIDLIGPDIIAPGHLRTLVDYCRAAAPPCTVTDYVVVGAGA
jgi:2-amino-4-hydroxy-6-hydroxymethyldihydropteridine diphosphokinase